MTGSIVGAGEPASAHRERTSMDIAELLAFSVKNKASDLHLSAGLPPMIRVHGDVRGSTCRRWSTRMSTA
jgi:Tfp pilus assembly pilus retraction ATPase PilT